MPINKYKEEKNVYALSFVLGLPSGLVDILLLTDFEVDTVF